MRARSFMLIAGEASGDVLAAELVSALRQEFAATPAVLTTDSQPLRTSLEPRFFGVGGPCMAAAGVELAFDLTAHSIFGAAALGKYFTFRRLFHRAFRLALDREPDAIIGVDFNLFNLLFAQAVRKYARARSGWFHDWRPKLIKYVSPQVWASREGRARQIARDYDLLLSIIPFEKKWYEDRVPSLRVEYVGHPIVDRFAGVARKATVHAPDKNAGNQTNHSPTLLLLPGSRSAELKRHLPVMLGALAIIRQSVPNVRARMIVPNEKLAAQAKRMSPLSGVDLQVDGLREALPGADLAVAKTGTITTECAYFGVPTIALYKAGWFTYQIGRRIVKVKFAALPNLLAGEAVVPEYIQGAATSENLAQSALELLQDENKRAITTARLSQVMAVLGTPGASRRAAHAILEVLKT